MNIKKRFIVIITAFILAVISGCATVSRESSAPMERQDQSQTQQREKMAPSPSVIGEMEEAEQQKKNKGSDDMERLD